MNYILMPSLEHIAVVKTAITLWRQDYIMTLVTDFSYIDKLQDTREWQRVRRKKWMEIEERVLENVLQLPLPKPLKDKISCVIKPIGLELFDWLIYHFKKFHMILPNRLCWTPQGTIDKRKTAEVLVRDENITLTKRYILACDNCLEEDIKELWDSVSKSNKALFNKRGNLRYPLVQTDFVGHSHCVPSDYRLVTFWTYYIAGEVTQLNNYIAEEVTQLNNFLMREIPPYKFCLKYATNGNKVALQYFLEKLNPVEREKYLTKNPVEVRRRFRMNSSDVSSFLLSQINKEEQIKLFTIYSFEVLDCLLKWPFQNFFMETYAAIHKLDLLDERKYMSLLENIMKKVSKGYKDWNYQGLLEQIWQKCPSTYKRYILHGWTGDYSSLLQNLAYQGNIKIIFKNVTALEKQQIIFSSRRCCRNLIYNSKWTMLKSFITECISSKDMMVEFKNEFNEDFEKMLEVSYLVDEQNDKWYMFYQLLNELIRKEDKKREMEKDENSHNKKFHSMKIKENDI